MRKIALLAIALIAGLALFMAFTMFGSKSQAHLSEEKKAQVLQRLKTLEMPFIENRGQTDERVAYYTKTFGGTLFITKEGELVYSFPKVEKAEKGKTPKVEGVAVIVERLSNAKVKELKALEKSPTNVSYFVGNDPKKWQTNIPTYRKVSLGEVYEGIKVELKAYGNNVEKLFYVSPGADPSKIRLELDGVKSAQVKESGELLLKTELGEIVFTKPVAYQEIGGKRVEVPVSYKVAKVDNKVVYGFEVKDYDKSKELVIDPLVQSTYLGGSGSDVALAIAIDSAGNVYVAGGTGSTNFPGTYGGAQPTYGGNSDAFVAKFDSLSATPTDKRPQNRQIRRKQ